MIDKINYQKLMTNQRYKTLLIAALIIAFLIALFSIEKINEVIVEARCLQKRMLFKECENTKPAKQYKNKFKSLEWIKRNTSAVSYPKIRRQFLHYAKKAIEQYWSIFANQYPSAANKLSKKQVLAFIDALARLEQGRSCMFAYNLFGVQGEDYWEVPEDSQPDYAFNIVDSGGYCRVFLGWKSMERAARFVAYVVMRKIFRYVNKYGEFNAGVVYTCSWWRSKCSGNSEEFAKIDTFNSIFRDSLRFV